MPREFLRRHWPWIVLFVAAAAYYPRFVHPGGMELYRHAAECVWTQQILQVCDRAFTYPPAFAFVMLPFVAMPIWLAVLLWYLITLACTAWCLVLCKKLALQLIPGPWEGNDLRWFHGISFLLSLKFILAVYEDQAYDLLVLPLTLWGLLALVERRNMAGATSLAIAAALKVTPLIFLPYLLFKRRFAAAGVFVVVLLAVSFLPDLLFTPQGGAHGYFVTWVHEVAAPGLFENAAATKYAFWDTANPFNLSLRGMIALGIDQTPYQASFMLILRVVQVVFIAAVGILFLMALGWEMIAVEGSLLIIAMLMLSPMSGRGHFVQLILPYCVLVAAWIKDRHTAWLGAAMLGVSFILCTGIPRDIVPRAYTEFMRMHSDIAWGTLVLIVYLAAIVWNPQRWGIARVRPDAQPVATASVTA
jgi:alpha-1,2-mannosyltransferase